MKNPCLISALMPSHFPASSRDSVVPAPITCPVVFGCAHKSATISPPTTNVASAKNLPTLSLLARGRGCPHPPPTQPHQQCYRPALSPPVRSAPPGPGGGRSAAPPRPGRTTRPPPAPPTPGT